MIKKALRQIAETLPLSIYMRLINRDVLGLYYHVISDKQLPHIQNLYQYKTPVMFENDLIYLEKTFNIVSYEELEASISGNLQLKTNSLIITFDDGLSECYSTARPLLLKYGIPCTFFITTDYIDNKGMALDLKTSLCIDVINSYSSKNKIKLIHEIKETIGKGIVEHSRLSEWIRTLASNEYNSLDKLCEILHIDISDYLKTWKPYMTTEEILCLNKEGFTIGAHSLSHQDFRTLNDLEIEKNIVNSSKIIKNLTGKPTIPFAFPYTLAGISRELLREFRNHFPFIGLFFGGGGISIDEDFVISRLCGDHPTNGGENLSNLDHRIKLAYLEEISGMLHRN